MKKFEEQLQAIIGFRGNLESIERRVSELSTGINVAIEKQDEQIDEGDLVYIFSLGMDGDEYLDFDLWVLETRNKDELYITGIDGIN